MVQSSTSPPCPERLLRSHERSPLHLFNQCFTSYLWHLHGRQMTNTPDLFVLDPPTQLPVCIPCPASGNTDDHLKLCRCCISWACVMSLTGSLVREGGSLLTFLAPQQWVAWMLWLLSSCKRWLAVWLPVSCPAPAQDFATWGSTDFKADLARMSHLCSMCVQCWWERKEAGILAGCDTRLLSTALSQCIRWRHLFFPSLCIACKLENSLGSQTEEGSIFPPPLQNVKHSERLGLWNWCRSYFISLVDGCSPVFHSSGYYFITSSLCVLWLEKISICC